MQYIDEKFKDDSPENTVERIKKILSDIGIELHEKWTDSGIENCCSLSVYYNNNYPSTNGKGISPAFARASGYGEFIERLQCGLFFYKYQSVEKDKKMDLESFAPDGKYMTKKELVETGEWMDYIIERYPSLTREKIANQCAMYAFTDNEILTVPYYSLFEDKYVYIPAAFVRYMCGSNGICVGNSREEAWLHALSEIIERHNNFEILTSGKPVHEISETVLRSFKTVGKILDKVKESGDYDIRILDYSLGTGFPVVATNIINKKTHNYLVNVAADPVLEIAIQRTLTEIFQGRTLKTFNPRHDGRVFTSLKDADTIENIVNQVENGNGIYTAEFFDVLPPEETLSFSDNCKKNNAELLKDVLAMYKTFSRPIYIRNYSFLGFNSFRFYIPGFSEVRSRYMIKPIQEYYFADKARDTLRNIENASDDELSELFIYHGMISKVFSTLYNFPRLTGIPMTKVPAGYLTTVHLAYAAYRLKNFDLMIKYLQLAISSTNEYEDERDYFDCVIRYVKMRQAKKSRETTFALIKRFYQKSTFEHLKERVEDDGNFFKGMLLNCTYPKCDDCKFKKYCCYQDARDVIEKAGKVYKNFTDGQNIENFKVDL